MLLFPKLKPSQNKKGGKNFLAGSWEKGIKNGAARKIFGPSYVGTALIFTVLAKWKKEALRVYCPQIYIVISAHPFLQKRQTLNKN